MNKTENLELREINEENAFVKATNYNYGGSGSGGGNDNGSGIVTGGYREFNQLLRETSVYINSNYDYYEINCPPETRLLQISVIENTGSFSPFFIVKNNYGNDVGTVDESYPANIRVKASNNKLFRLHRGINSTAKIRIACYTCECAL
ncbi:MAG: hypothetical protein ACK5KT_00040 [Dysgonomonas sp.]